MEDHTTVCVNGYVGPRHASMIVAELICGGPRVAWRGCRLQLLLLGVNEPLVHLARELCLRDR